jgi:FXSXX-COOH protein
MPDTITRVPSKLADLRSVPLADMPGLDAVTLESAVGRVIPDSDQAAPVTVAAFQSSI